MIVTFFTDHTGQTARARQLELAELKTLALSTVAPVKSQLPWLKLASFGDQRTPRGSLRNNANVLTISGIEADYDQGKVTPEQAADTLRRAGIGGLVYTSPSHMADLPRWRVLCPTSDALPPSARADLVARLNHVLGGILSTESFTLSQAYYYGRTPDSMDHTAVIVPGQPIDAMEDIPARYPERRPAEPIALPPHDPNATPDERTTQALALALAAFAQRSSESDRHHTLLSATNTLAPFILSGHLDPADAEDQLSEAMAADGREPNPGEVSGAITGALRMATPYAPPSHGAEFPPLPELAQPVTFLEITEDHAARLFARAHSVRYKYDHAERAWFAFTPSIGWGRDAKGGVINTARHFLHTAREQWGIEAKETQKAASIGFVSAVVRGCESDPLTATSQEEWDTDPMLLGVPGGFVDLHTADLHRADPARLIRRRAGVSPVTAEHPIWTRFLDESTGGDSDLQAWLQRFAGYALTGDVSEELLAFVYGPGGNGKGVFLRTLSAILGSYAYQAPAELFKADSRTNREYQIAKLDGIRLLMVSETEAGSALAEAFVKEITGNEGQLNARHPFGRPFEFRSQAKVLIVGNHAPKLNGRSEAMERRLRVVPFNRKPARRDLDLKDKLIPEYPAILAWAIRGCLLWQRDRVGVCDAVRLASESYFEEQDTITQWITERCDVKPELSCGSSLLLEDFNTWLRARGERPTDAKAFKEYLAKFPNIYWKKSNAANLFVGVSLKNTTSISSNFQLP